MPSHPTSSASWASSASVRASRLVGKVIPYCMSDSLFATIREATWYPQGAPLLWTKTIRSIVVVPLVGTRFWTFCHYSSSSLAHEVYATLHDTLCHIFLIQS